MLVTLYQFTWNNIPEDFSLQQNVIFSNVGNSLPIYME